MVFIPVRSQIVSLIITIVILFIEITALSITLTLNRIAETRILQNDHPVQLYRHCQRVKLATFLVMISFVAIEIYASLYSLNASRDITTRQPCVSMTKIQQPNKPISNQTESIKDIETITFNCIKPNSTTVTQYVGDLRSDTGDVSCAAEPLYEYNTSVKVNRSLSKATKLCREQNASSPFSSTFCLYYEYNGDMFYYSTSIALGFSEDEPIEFYPTKLYFNASLLLSTIIDRLFSYYFEIREIEELHLRRRLFTDVVKTECTFVSHQVKGTRVALHFLIFLGVSFLLAMIMNLVLILSTRKKRIVDLSDPFVWVDGDNLYSKKEVQVMMSEEMGSRLVVSIHEK